MQRLITAAIAAATIATPVLAGSEDRRASSPHAERRTPSKNIRVTYSRHRGQIRRAHPARQNADLRTRTITGVRPELLGRDVPARGARSWRTGNRFDSRHARCFADDQRSPGSPGCAKPAAAIAGCSRAPMWCSLA